MQLLVLSQRSLGRVGQISPSTFRRSAIKNAAGSLRRRIRMQMRCVRMRQPARCQYKYDMTEEFDDQPPATASVFESVCSRRTGFRMQRALNRQYLLLALGRHTFCLYHRTTPQRSELTSSHTPSGVFRGHRRRHISGVVVVVADGLARPAPAPGQAVVQHFA